MTHIVGVDKSYKIRIRVGAHNVPQYCNKQTVVTEQLRRVLIDLVVVNSYAVVA